MTDTLRGKARAHRAERVEQHRERADWRRANGTRLRGLTPEDAAAHATPPAPKRTRAHVPALPVVEQPEFRARVVEKQLADLTSKRDVLIREQQAIHKKLGKLKQQATELRRELHALRQR